MDQFYYLLPRAPDGEFSATYSSWARDFIGGSSHLNSLCLFFDRVYLPYPHLFDFWHGARLFTFLDDGPGHPRIGAVKQRSSPSVTFDELEKLQEKYQTWLEEYSTLFEAGLIRHLPAPKGLFGPTESHLKQMLDYLYGPTKGSLEQFGDPYQLQRLRIEDVLDGHFDVALHALTARKPSPEIFIGTAREHQTVALAGVLADATLTLSISDLSDLSSSQILELRQSVDQFRSGFRDHLLELVDDVESRVSADDHNFLVAALKTAERKIMPGFNEYQRQLLSREVGFWSKAGARSAKFLQVDASPFTPKFWGAILECLFGNLDSSADLDRETFSNESQAFQYLGALAKQNQTTHNGCSEP